VKAFHPDKNTGSRAQQKKQGQAGDTGLPSFLQPVSGLPSASVTGSILTGTPASAVLRLAEYVYFLYRLPDHLSETVSMVEDGHEALRKLCEGSPYTVEELFS